MSGTHTCSVSDDEAGERLDFWLTRRPGIRSRAFGQQLIEQGLVEVDGAVVAKHHKVAAGEQVTYTIPEPDQTAVQAEPLPLNIIFEDDDLIVLSKPAGMVVHPAAGHPSGTLVNALLAHVPALRAAPGAPYRPGIVHRLDKDTSGLMVVAKTDEAYAALSRQLKERLVKREYVALVHGSPEPPEGLIRAPIGRSPRDGKKMAVAGRGSREAETRYRVAERVGEYSLLELRLLTGRTHQIRVHLAYAGYPVAGDPTYGGRRAGKPPGLSRQFLHARRLEFVHPRTRERVFFKDDLPEDLARILQELR